MKTKPLRPANHVIRLLLDVLTDGTLVTIVWHEKDVRRH